ncbi:MAG TPA: hypothetical protein VMZ28_07580, partial [Kofleriaceae bacterium]|nr:hypothetical protein [Kofleriaceae bacterium]
MNRLSLTPGFRRRLLPLVAVTALVVAAGAPLAFFLQKRQELVGGARTNAERVSGIVADARLQHPRLWRYDAPKIAERLAADGIAGDAVVVHDALGR